MHDKLVYYNYTLCHICNEELDKDRVRDHCHLSGKFRGAAHEICNLKYKVQKFFQLYFTIRLAMIAKEIFLVYQRRKLISFTKQVIVDKFVHKE